MSTTTVAQFATELKKTTAQLIDQLNVAGVAKASASDVLTDADKQKLLGFLQTSHGTVIAERKKITLTKKSTTEIKQADATGKARTIQVEVRKKRTFIQRDDEDAAVLPAAEAAAVVEAPTAHYLDDAELARREQDAMRQAELLRRQEEELAQRRQDREAKEAAERAAIEVVVVPVKEQLVKEVAVTPQVPAKEVTPALVEDVIAVADQSVAAPIAAVRPQSIGRIGKIIPESVVPKPVQAAIAPALDALETKHGVPWQVLDGFLYPGHNVRRMHAVPEKTGAGLMARLLAAQERAQIPLLVDAKLAQIFTDDRNELLSAVHRADAPMSATELSSPPQHNPALPVRTLKRPGFLRGMPMFGGHDNHTQAGIGNDSMNDRGMDHAG